MVDQGTHKTPDLTAVLSKWDLIGYPFTYGLYLRSTQEHVTPIERIPVSQLRTRASDRRRYPLRS